MKLAFFSLCAALTLSACSGGSGEKNEVRARAAAIDWREIATANDRARLRQWRTAWMQGIGKAEAAGHRTALAGEGALLQPDAAMAWESPPAGMYDCRVLKIGAKNDVGLDYVAYPPFDCRLRVENGTMSFAKLSGSRQDRKSVV